MIDLSSEKMVLLKKAGKLLPGSVHVATLYRWADGVDVVPRRKRGEKAAAKTRVQLETLFIAGDRWTSAEAVQRFIEAYTTARDGKSSSVALRPSRARQQDVKAAQDALEAAGFGNKKSRASGGHQRGSVLHQTPSVAGEEA